MPRRPARALKRLIQRRRRRPTSVADGWGFVYIIFEGVTAAGDWIVKIGMTIDVSRRLGEHDRLCPNPARGRLVFIRLVNFRRRQGTLVRLRFCYTNSFRTRGAFSSRGRENLR
jgi:hypothetical protein